MVQVSSEPFVAARRASFMTQDSAAEVCGMKARQTFALREENPRDMTLGNLVDVYEAMNEHGKKLLRDAVAALFVE